MLLPMDCSEEPSTPAALKGASSSAAELPLNWDNASHGSSIRLAQPSLSHEQPVSTVASRTPPDSARTRARHKRGQSPIAKAVTVPRILGLLIIVAGGVVILTFGAVSFALTGIKASRVAIAFATGLVLILAAGLMSIR